MNEDNEILDAIEARIQVAGPIYDTTGMAQDILDIVKNGNHFVAMSEFAKREEEWATDIDCANAIAAGHEVRAISAEKKLQQIREALRETI